MAEKQPDADEWARWRWELRLPPWQRKLNRFCENWIFAFFVAMAIRHFALEAYRIPTASMEPMLYGDPAMSRADHVVVDKLLFRFTGPDRWGVTVFQFPWPEVAGPQGPAQPVRAWDGRGERSDSFPFNPQLNRNFVKRCVVKPGDEFYISGGDLYVREDDAWRIPPKPADVQEALWMPIYEHGAQEGYLPWQGLEGAAVEARDEDLAIVVRGGLVHFSQPLINLYLKPGQVKVKPRSGGPFAVVTASMTEPQFTYQVGSRPRTGNIWKLQSWSVHRLTSADLDNVAEHGTVINDKVGEYLGDLRVGFTLEELDGPVTLALEEGDAVAIPLHLEPQAWRVTIDGPVVAEGNDAPVGSHWQVVNCDNRAQVLRDGEAVAEPVAVAATDPGRIGPEPDTEVHRSRLVWRGAGAAVVGALRIERDLHYAANGFLSDQRSRYYLDRSRMRQEDYDQALARQALTRHELLMLRRQIIARLVDDELRARLTQDLEEAVAGRRRSDWLRPLGVDPATALRAPENGYLLLGDNSIFSWDGRNWGWVPAANLRGEVLWVVFPFSRMKVVE